VGSKEVCSLMAWIFYAFCCMRGSPWVERPESRLALPVRFLILALAFVGANLAQ